MDNNQQVLLQRAESLGGPTIGGTVSVSLIELDTLRANYANAVKAFRELASHAKEVKIVIVNGDSSSNKIVDKNSGMLEQSITWKNLDDVREIIAVEERARLADRFKELEGRVEAATKEVDKFASEKHAVEQELVNVNAAHKEAMHNLKLEMLGAEKKAAEELRSVNQFLREESDKHFNTVKELEETTRKHNELLSRVESLQAQFNDVSQKYIRLREEKAPWWKFW